MDETATLVARMQSALQRLRSAVRRLNGDALTATRGGGWSVREIVEHVRASDAIMTPRIYQVLARDRPPLPGFDERAWAALAARAEVPLDAQLAAFAIMRAELCGLLRTLSPAEWARSGVHEERGEVAVIDIARRIASHEDEHVAQVEAAAR
jgi:hypothetical protein